MIGIIFALISAGFLLLYGMVFTFIKTLKLANNLEEKRNWKFYGVKLGVFSGTCFLIAYWLVYYSIVST